MREVELTEEIVQLIFENKENQTVKAKDSSDVLFDKFYTKGKDCYILKKDDEYYFIESDEDLKWKKSDENLLFKLKDSNIKEYWKNDQGNMIAEISTFHEGEEYYVPLFVKKRIKTVNDLRSYLNRFFSQEEINEFLAELKEKV